MQIFIIKRTWDNGRYDIMGFLTTRAQADAYASAWNMRRDRSSPFGVVEVEEVSSLCPMPPEAEER